MHVSFTADPSNAMVYAEALGHIQAALRCLADMAKPAEKPVEKKSGGMSPETLAELKAAREKREAAEAEKAEAKKPEPEADETDDEPEAEEKTAKRGRGRPRKEKPAPKTLDDMEGEELLSAVREITTKARDKVGIRAIGELIRGFGARALSDLDDEQLREVAEGTEQLLADAD